MKTLVSVAPAFAAAAAACVLAGCGSGPDASSGSEVAGVLVVSSNNGGCCSNGGSYLGGVAQDAAGLFASTSSANGPTPGVYAVRFAPPGLTPFPFNGQNGNTGQGSSDVELALSPDGVLWWAQPAQASVTTGGSGPSTWPGIAVWTADEKTAPSATVQPWASFPLATPSTMGGFPFSGSSIVGLVADADAIYVAAAVQPSNTASGPSSGPTAGSPDAPGWPNPSGGASSQHAVTPGRVFAIARNPAPGSLQAAPPSVPASFDPTSAIHTLVATSGALAWLGVSMGSDHLDEVLGAPKGWATGVAPAPAPTVLTKPADLPPAWSLVAIASRGSTVAWAAAPDVQPGATGCRVWASQNGGAPSLVFDGSQAAFFCRGLAIDDQYAYVTMNDTVGVPAGQGPYAVVGSGVARVPLAGGPVQMLPLQSQSWYGPRRVLVDDTYVYGVDPSYVVRVPKTAFGQ